MKIFCACGKQFERPIDYVQHYRLMKPSARTLSRLLPWVTKELVEKSKQDVEEYNKLHHVL